MPSHCHGVLLQRAVAIHVRGGARRAFQTAMAAGEQQYRVAMHLPETLQQLMSRFWQRNETIPVAFGIADMHAPAWRVDIANPKSQPFAQTQAHAVEREEKDTVTDDARGGQ